MSEVSDTPYAGLSPEVILSALESVGLHPTGGLVALNSYENRVYQVELDDESFVVTKFYRPERWSDAQILEEHAFVLELEHHELPCVAPVQLDSATLFDYQGFRFSIYPRLGGRTPNIEIEEDLKVLSRTLARIHAVGSLRTFEHRVDLHYERMAVDSRSFLIEGRWIPTELEEAYTSITEHLLSDIQALWHDVPRIRTHGDCHLGNLLWRDETPNFVDFDDCVNGPPIQDLWMLLSGEREERQAQLNTILEAYESFYSFDYTSLRLIEALRTLRIMHHAAWLARRWDDPAFPIAFPWFNTGRYWADHVLDLREQQAALQEPPLTG